MGLQTGIYGYCKRVHTETQWKSTLGEKSNCVSGMPVRRQTNQLHPQPWLSETGKWWIHVLFLSFLFSLGSDVFGFHYFVFHFFYPVCLVRFSTDSGTEWKVASRGPPKSMCWHELSWQTLVSSFHLISVVPIYHLTLLSEVWHVTDFCVFRWQADQLVHVMFIQAPPSGRSLQCVRCLYRCARSSLCVVGVLLCEIFVCVRCITVWDHCMW